MTIKRRGKPPERSVTLLIATQRGRQLIAACCAQAESRGVRVGMTLAHARSLLQGQCVEVADYSPDKDRQALERLAVWALRFTPIVAVDEPDGLLMDIAGCEHLYGGELPMAQRIAHAIARLGLNQRLAVGPTFFATRITARHAAERFMIFHEATLPEVIAEFPIEALRIEPSICENLYAVGVERIDQLLSLPREALASRYGVGLLRCLDQLLGTATELIVSYPSANRSRLPFLTRLTVRFFNWRLSKPPSESCCKRWLVNFEQAVSESVV